jgi:hypothetical protein
MVQGICAQCLATTVPPSQVIMQGGKEVGTGKSQTDATYLYVGDIADFTAMDWQKLGYYDPKSKGRDANPSTPTFKPLEKTELADALVFPPFHQGTVPFPS